MVHLALALLVGGITLAALRFKPLNAGGYLLPIFMGLLSLAALVYFTGLTKVIRNEILATRKTEVPSITAVIFVTPTDTPTPSPTATNTSTPLPSDTPTATATPSAHACLRHHRALHRAAGRVSARNRGPAQPWRCYPTGSWSRCCRRSRVSAA